MATQYDPALARYISTVHELPRLDREQEQVLVERWFKHADVVARDALVRDHLRYVVAIALKYRRYGLPLSELVSEGNFGVLHALKKFEPERGHRFVTYAAYWIRAYILNHIIRSWSLVGVGSGALRSKMFFKLRRERARALNLVGDDAQVDELLAKKFNVTPDQISAMVQRLDARDLSLDTRVYDDSGLTLADTLVAQNADQESVAAANESAHKVHAAVREAVARLDDRERYIVEKRLMADDEEAMSLAEIGRRLGVSRERARQLEARAKRKLKTHITERATRTGMEISLDSAA